MFTIFKILDDFSDGFSEGYATARRSNRRRNRNTTRAPSTTTTTKNPCMNENQNNLAQPQNGAVNCEMVDSSTITPHNHMEVNSISY